MMLASILLFLAAAASTFRADDSPDSWKGVGTCEPNCDYNASEFCGTDNTCYPYSCENFYRYGPSNFVGHDQDPNDLVCSQETVPPDLREFSVVYGCTGYSNTEPGQGEAVVQRYTERCETQNRNTSFVCYQMASNDTSAFDTFLRNVQNNAVVCKNETDTPRFIYQIQFLTLEFGIFWGPNGHDIYTFNETLARRTMWMQLSELENSETSGAKGWCLLAVPLWILTVSGSLSLFLSI